MRLIAAILVPLVILTAVLGPQFLFTVDQTQLALVTRFGEPRSQISSPGLYVKTPFVDSVRYFDKRLLVFDLPPDSLLTEDKRRLIIDVYARARINNPLLFYQTVGTEANARARVNDIIASELRREIALDLQEEIVRTSRESIMNRIRDAADNRIETLGLELVDVRMKRTDFPTEVQESIYLRMRAERQRIADRERAEGAERDAEIRAAVDREATVIQAEAERDANIIRGEGEGEAIRIFAEALEQDPEFYAFQRSLDAYRSFMTTNTTVVLPSNSELFQYLQTPFGQVRQGEGSPGSEASPVLTQLMQVESAARTRVQAEMGTNATNGMVLASFESVEWSDTSMGCPQPGASYAAAVVPGYKLIFDNGGDKYAVHSDKNGNAMIVCEQG
jgi:membrane protease subunit HflC